MWRDRNAKPKGPRTGDRSLADWFWLGVTLLVAWVVTGVFLVGFWDSNSVRSWTSWLLLIFISPPIYLFGEWLIPRLWTDDSIEDDSETRAMLKRLGRFALALGGTVGFFVLFYFILSLVPGFQ